MGTIGFFWGIIGVLFFLGFAVLRLGGIAYEGLMMELTWYHIAFLIPWLIFMAIGEGYRGFQQNFSPRVAARTKYLRKNPKPLWVLFAPVFVMGFIHATPHRRKVVTFLTLGIFTLVMLMEYIPQPWRGIVDAGVVLGLVWGMTALLVFAILAWFNPNFDVDPETPEHN